ncbi:colicin-like pore-forming protein [Avibacterium avium]|uniref:colicin-like pore-forming protein n=1 Tax=Avibacterium avium TaxID=751 RepID=UPI003BF8E17C
MSKDDDIDTLDEIEVCADEESGFNCVDNDEPEPDSDFDENMNEGDNYDVFEDDSSSLESDSNNNDESNLIAAKDISIQGKPFLFIPNQQNSKFETAEFLNEMMDAQTIIERRWRGGFIRKFREIKHLSPNALSKDNVLERLQRGEVKLIHDRFMNRFDGISQMNITNLAFEKTMLEQHRSDTSEWQEIYTGISEVMDAYKTTYEKILDGQLAKDYQTLALNFKYSPARVDKASQRYHEFMTGKKLKISKSDQKILDQLVKLEDTAQLQKMAKQLHNVSNLFGVAGKVITIGEIVTKFNEAQRTKQWNDFFTAVSAQGAGVLVGSLTALALSTVSLPAGLIIATLSVVATHYVSDEGLWKQILQPILE